jgi:nucleoid DNA-binding protein
MKKISHEDVINKVANETGTSLKSTKEFLNTYLQVIKDFISSGAEEVKLGNLGRFKIKEPAKGIQKKIDLNHFRKTNGKEKIYKEYRPTSKIKFDFNESLKSLIKNS